MSINFIEYSAHQLGFITASSSSSFVTMPIATAVLFTTKQHRPSLLLYDSLFFFRSNKVNGLGAASMTSSVAF